VVFLVLGEILRVENLKKHFTKKNWLGRESSLVRAVDGVTFTVNGGESFVLAGESGSGKSTIAKLILRAIEPDTGRIVFDGAEITAKKEDLKRIRMECQMVYQDPYDSINPQMKVKDIIAEPLEIHKIGDIKQRILEVLHEVKLEPAEEIMEKYPHLLSGGQRQRVVLARALVLKPKLIIADEPVSMLDVSIRAEILELMESLREKHGISFVYITHDLATARYFGTRIGILYLGKLVEVGPVSDVLLSPRHPYTQALLDAVLEPDPKNLNKEKTIRINEPLKIDVYSGCRFRARCPYAFEKCEVEPPLEKSGDREVACFAKID
jgi:peptide/nickel transport system ATP-binding protein